MYGRVAQAIDGRSCINPYQARAGGQAQHLVDEIHFIGNRCLHENILNMLGDSFIRYK